MSNLKQTSENNRKKKEIEETQKILSKWNPLGAKKTDIKDLNDYETEANDIVFHIRTEFHFPKKGNPLKRNQRIIKEVLNEAFNLSLSDDDCKDSATELMEILK